MKILIITAVLLVSMGCLTMDVNTKKGDGVADFAIGVDLTAMESAVSNRIMSLKFWGEKNPEESEETWTK